MISCDQIRLDGTRCRREAVTEREPGLNLCADHLVKFEALALAFPPPREHEDDG